VVKGLAEEKIRRIDRQILFRALAYNRRVSSDEALAPTNRLAQPSASERIYIQREIVYVPVSTPMVTDEARGSAFDRDIVEILLAHQRRIEELERRIRNGTYRQVIVPRGDPPCVVCGTWSDDWLCPSCRTKYPWMRP
jgi:rubrerythrin